MALTDQNQQAMIDQAMARAKSLGISEQEAQTQIAQKLKSSGYTVIDGKLSKAGQKQSSAGVNIIPGDANQDMKYALGATPRNRNTGLPQPVQPATPSAPVAPVALTYQAPSKPQQPVQPVTQPQTQSGNSNADKLKSAGITPEQLSAAIGYDISGAINDPSRKIELESAIKKYAEKKQAEDWQKNEKAAGQTIGKAPAMTQNDLIRRIYTGQIDDSVKNDPYYANATSIVDKVKRFAGQTEDEMAQSILNGGISQEQADAISSIDPNFQSKFDSAKRKAAEKIRAGVTNSFSANLAGNAAGVATKFEDDPVIVAMNKMMADMQSATAVSAEETAKKVEIAEKEKQIKELVAQRDKIYDDLVKQSPGAPKSLLMAEAAEKAKPLNEQITSLTNDANFTLAKYNALVDERKNKVEQFQNMSKIQIAVAERYSALQKAEADEIAKKLNVDTKVETLMVDGSPKKVLINADTGETIKILGPDMSTNRYQVVDNNGVQMAYDNVNNKFMPIDGNLPGNPKQETALAKEYGDEVLVKNHDILKNAYTNANKTIDELERTPSGPDAVKQIALMYSFIKAIDPTSVVRESEVALLKETLSLMDQLSNATQGILKGQVLPGPTIAKVAGAISQLYNTSRDDVAKLQSNYIKRAGDVQARADRIFGGRDIYASSSMSSLDSYLSDDEDSSVLDNFYR